MQKNMKPAEIAALPEHELQRAILNAMLERERTPTGGMLDTTRPGGEIIDHAALHGNLDHLQLRQLTDTIERKFRRAFEVLQAQRLIEAPSGNPSHRVLTQEGRDAAKNPLDLQTILIRARLVPEMLHPKLRRKPYTDFANGEPTSAIQEAFKILDIEVQNAANMQQLFGQNLMLEAFDHAKGPLTDKSENDVMRKALPRLFAGAVGRFRNTSTHTHRTFPDLHEAIEELLVASRLLRFLDEPGRK